MTTFEELRQSTLKLTSSEVNSVFNNFLDNKYVANSEKVLDGNSESLNPIVLEIDCNRSWGFDDVVTAMGKEPIVLVNGIAELKNVDLNCFKTEALKTIKELTLPIRKQSFKNNPKNVQYKNSWRRYSVDLNQRMSVKSFQSYQDEQLNVKLQEGDLIKIATNVDLDPNDKRFVSQAQQLERLETFGPNHATDMMRTLNYSIQGINSAQLFVKVNGSFTPIHTENAWLYSININAGDADVTWMGFDKHYTERFETLCKDKGFINLSSIEIESTWPDVHELEKKGIPVYSFRQKKGQTVVVAPGCYHWVESNGVTTNIAWNIGHCSLYQYINCWIKELLSRKTKYKSIIPLLYLSWKIASNLKLSDDLSECIKSVLQISAMRCICTESFIKTIGIQENKIDEVEEGEFSKLRCSDCERELEFFGFRFSKTAKSNICFTCLRKLKNISLGKMHVKKSTLIRQISNTFNTLFLTRPNQNEIQNNPTIAESIETQDEMVDWRDKCLRLEGKVELLKEQLDKARKESDYEACEFEGCDFKFNKKPKSSLKYRQLSHSLTHKDPTVTCPYVLNGCDLMFADQTRAKRHAASCLKGEKRSRVS